MIVAVSYMALLRVTIWFSWLSFWKAKHKPVHEQRIFFVVLYSPPLAGRAGIRLTFDSERIRA